MGYTKTIRQCQRPRGMDLDQLIAHRAQLRESLQEYLANDACVEGAPASAEGLDKYADLLVEAFTGIVALELGGHESHEDSYQTMASFAAVFAELWRIPAMAGPSRLRPLVTDVPVSATEFVMTEAVQRLVDRANAVKVTDADHEEALTLASLLAKSYLKALAELREALKGNDLFVIKHHGSLVGDLLDEMLELVQYPDPRDEQLTEYDLPQDHPHWRARQEVSSTERLLVQSERRRPARRTEQIQ